MVTFELVAGADIAADRCLARTLDARTRRRALRCGGMRVALNHKLGVPTPLRPTLDRRRTARPWPIMSRFLTAPRRFSYLVMGGMLSMGAPIGLAFVRLAALGELSAATLTHEVKQDWPTFLYVTVSTLAVFAVFGYVLGRQADVLVDLSWTDPLTGLRNRRAFEDRLAGEVVRAGRYRTPLSLLIVDVDGLKAINDRGGHHAGDVALRAVAAALRQDARQTDLPARVGGDEFALIAPHTDVHDAVALAERIRCRVAEDVARITISLGVATLDLEQPDAAALRQEGDAALYEAKHRGRNRVFWAAPPAAGEKGVLARLPAERTPCVTEHCHRTTWGVGGEEV